MKKSIIRVGGTAIKPAEVTDWVEVTPGVYSVLHDGQSHEIVIAGSEVEVDGIRLQVEIDDPRKWNPASASRSAEGKEAVKAPMPGKVVRILVVEGEQVIKGQGLIVVEAMKMQNELKSPRAGRVASIAVKEHEPVNAGAILLAIE